MKKIIVVCFVSFLLATATYAQRVLNIQSMGPDSYGYYDSTITKAIELATTIGSSFDTLYFPRGTYLLGVNRLRLNPLNPRGCRVFNNGNDPQTPTSILICNTRKKIVFSGEGASTILQLGNIAERVAELGFPNMGYHMFQIVNSDSIYFENMIVDGNRLQLTQQEQQHIFEIQGSRNVAFRNITFRNAKGDGINMIGLATEVLGNIITIPTDSVTIQDNSFINCDRSGIAFQRLVKNVVIYNNKFERTGDQDIDFEPSNFGVANRRGSIENVRIAKNNFIKNNKVISVTLSCGKNIVFSNNTIVNSGLQAAISLENFTISNNRFIKNSSDSTGNKPRLLLLGELSGGVISNNYIDSSDRNATIILETDNNRHGKDIVITDNTIYGGININSFEKIIISGNTIFGKSNSLLGISIQNVATGFNAEVDITDNRIKNFPIGINIAPRSSNFSRLKIDGNYFKTDSNVCVKYNNSPNASILTTPEITNNVKEGSPHFYKFITGFYPKYHYLIYGGTGFGDISKMYIGYVLPVSVNPNVAPSGSLFYVELNNNHNVQVKIFSNHLPIGWLQVGVFN